MKNPLLEPNQIPEFSKIKPQHIAPALKQILTESRTVLKKLLAQPQPFTWQKLMQPMEDLDDKLHRMWGAVSHLQSVVNSKPLREAHNQCLPELSAYLTEIGHNRELYEAIKSIKESSQWRKLDKAQKKLINDELRDFKLAGVALSPKAKENFTNLQQQLALLSNKFSENLLDATQDWTKLITDKKQLAGLPEHSLKTAQAAAKEKNKTGWLITLEQPSYIAVMTYANSRGLRQEIYTAYVTRASDQGPNAGKYDNSEVMQNILDCKKQLADLLDFTNYAECSLATRMAKNSKQVLAFLNNLARRSKDKAKQEYKELQKFAAENYKISKLFPWDLAYFSEKLQQQKFDISQEQLRPYFPEQQVLEGIFKLVKKLFGITVKRVETENTWHKDVKVFEVYDQNKNLCSRFYLDLYARSNKQGGAWMNDYQTRRQLNNKRLQTPIAFIVCNFNAPVGNDPALFTHDDVDTLFHEFGHALQHMLTKIDYAGVSGINGVPWDAVELPSQFMENWCWEKTVIKLISKHYKTGKPLPDKMFNNLLAAKQFHSGLQMLRQIELSLFDFRLHLEFDPKQKNQIQTILDEVRQKIAVIPTVDFNRFQHGFAHIFAGGYAAGYYSYKWAEVLSCDAFAKFEEDGIFNEETGASFLHNILETGGSEDPATLFKKFRGRAPKIDALLKHSGIKNG